MKMVKYVLEIERMNWTGSLLYRGVLFIIFILNNLLIIGEARYCGTQKKILNQCGEILVQRNSSGTDDIPISMKKSLMRGLAQFYTPWKKIFQNQYSFKPSKNDATDSDLYEDGMYRKINQDLKLKDEPVLNMKPKIKKLKKTDDDGAKDLNIFERDNNNSKMYAKDEENQNMALQCNKDLVISTAYPPKRKMTLSFYTVITEQYDEEPDDIKAAVGPNKIKPGTQKSCSSNQVVIINAPCHLGTLPVMVVKNNDTSSLTITITNKTDGDKSLKNNCEINQRKMEKDAVALTYIKPEFDLIGTNNKYTPKKRKNKPQINHLSTTNEIKLYPDEMDLRKLLLQIQKYNHKPSLSPTKPHNIKKYMKEKKIPMYLIQKDLEDYPYEYVDITTTRNNITDLQSKINENLIEQLILLKKIKMS